MFQSLMEEEIPNSNPSWWKRRTQLEKCLMVTFMLAVIVIISLLVALHTSHPLTPPEQNVTAEQLQLRPSFPKCPVQNRKVCMTPGCVKAAAAVLESIDPHVEPCDDFYRFACGNYIKKSIISDDKTANTMFSTLTDQLQERLRSVLTSASGTREARPIKLVKNYYKACMNTKVIEDYGLNLLKDILKEVGGWPVLEGDKWNDGDFDWKKLMYHFEKLGIEATSFLELTVGSDLKNSNIRSIQLDQPEFGLSREFLVKGTDDKIVKAYMTYMVDVAVTLGADKNTAKTELEKSLNFEIQLAKYSMSKEDRRNISNLYNVMNVSQLQEKYSDMPWLEFINNLLAPEAQVGSNETLILISPKYVGALMNLINQTSKRVQANYAIWRAIKQQIPYLNDQLQKHELTYHHVMKGVNERQSRWKECVDEVATSLPLLAGSIYIRKYFPQAAKKNAQEMVTYIKDTFMDMLRSLDWMDEITRINALHKAKAVVDHIGYPDELLDDRKLDEYYKTLDIDPDEYLRSHLNIEIHSTTTLYRRLRQPVNKTDWVDHGNVAQVNAYYHPLENSIMFPAGILQGAFFGEDRPRYMNFAAIGSVIGHELTHGFDDTGRQFDQDGNLIDWWEKKTEEAFLEKTQCIIYQYGNYTVPEINQKLNGINTQGENIADNGGIKEAYLAYKAWVGHHAEEPTLPGLDYTPDQIFWISGAMNWCAVYRPEMLEVLIAIDNHSPNEFRVAGPFSNLEYFANDFGCPLNTKMNPEHKCSVW